MKPPPVLTCQSQAALFMSSWILVTLGHIVSKISAESVKSVYCATERLQQECPPNTVIIIEEAQYGRLEENQCIGSTNLGCSSNVTREVEAKCGGRQSCADYVLLLVAGREPCGRDFKSYLQVIYRCEHSPSSGLIASASYWANKHCSLWRVQAEQGQTIKFHLLLYKPKNGTDPSQLQLQRCPWRIRFTEGSDVHELRLCAAHPSKHIIHLSKSNEVEVDFIMNGTETRAPVFVINYTAHGCPDIATPPGAIVTRNGNASNIRCENGHEQWHFWCRGNDWFGHNTTQNCSIHSDNRGFQKGFGSSIPYPQGLIIAIILGIFLGVIIGCVSLGVLFILRHRRRQGFNRPTTADEARQRLRQSSPAENIPAKRVPNPKTPVHYPYDAKHSYQADSGVRQERLQRNVYHGEQIEGYQDAGATHAHSGPPYGKHKSHEYEFPRGSGEQESEGKMYFDCVPEDSRHNRRST